MVTKLKIYPKMLTNTYKTVLSMRKRQFKRYTKGKYILPIKDFSFSVYYGTRPTLFARGLWKKEYEDIDLVFRSTDLAISARNSVVKSLGWNKNVIYMEGSVAILSFTPLTQTNIYGIFNNERDMLKFKLRN